MICLTGDVHQPFGHPNEQDHLSSTELASALEWARIVEAYGLEATLFTTGKALVDDPTGARKLAALPHIELGGHGWSAFKPSWFYEPLMRLGGRCGPPAVQRWDIDRALRAFDDVLGRTVRSWRGHAYRSDETTRRILADRGVRVISDEVSSQQPHPSAIDGLVELPINTPPDHEHVVHGSHGPDNRRYTVDGWVRRVSEEIDAIEASGGVATVLAHPICMAVADGLAGFEQLCSHISRRGYETARCRDVA